MPVCVRVLPYWMLKSVNSHDCTVYVSFNQVPCTLVKAGLFATQPFFAHSAQNVHA